MVVLRENPSVKVRRDIIAHIHLCKFLVERHLLIIDLDAFLESDGIVVFSCIDGLRNPRVGAIGSDHDINLENFWCTNTLVPSIVRVLDQIRVAVSSRHLHLSDQAVDRLCTELDGTVTKVAIHDLTTKHTNVLVWFKSLANVNFPVRGTDHLHLTDFAVDDVGRKIKFVNHTEWNGTTARFAVVHLTLDDPCVDILILGKDFSRT
mmetsp:Transcript_13770/g.18295  ORF Transcript_13770/g.18295 Transcript_13770/m.18295 type:complete len:206 (-) Transcript_13770:215-832(-)